MLKKNSISWLLTSKGKQFSFCVITTAGIGCSLARFAPNTYFLNKYKDLVHRYQNGHPSPVSDELRMKFEKCLEILQIPESKRNLIQPFSVIGLELFRAGTLSSRFGSLVGIPINFTYKSIEDIDKENLQVNLKPVDWDKGMGKQLGESLILSDDVQLFAICREILSLNNNKLFFDAAYPMISIFFIYNLAQTINKRLNLYSAPGIIRLALYSIVSTFGLGIYFFLKDFTEVRYETEVDRELAALGPKFIESGALFYDKLLKRNQALRELMGREGEGKYTKLGNENYLLRQPSIALTHRKQYFESLLKKEKNNEENQNSI